MTPISDLMLRSKVFNASNYNPERLKSQKNSHFSFNKFNQKIESFYSSELYNNRLLKQADQSSSIDPFAKRQGVLERKHSFVSSYASVSVIDLKIEKAPSISMLQPIPASKEASHNDVSSLQASQQGPERQNSKKPNKSILGGARKHKQLSIASHKSENGPPKHVNFDECVKCHDISDG